ncbi:hypothetical protein [Microbacterium sp. K24]|uniref:hypothetical protein n=1 Tax=Microbacterium sp. K24 TaxID=2305446 RepID=UPI00109C866D|nr:hypothetical protein [Microbacterium sp. K24]
MVMYDQRPVPARASRPVWFSKAWCASLKAKEQRALLVVPNAKGFEIADEAATGALILESIETEPGMVTFAGAILCIVRVAVADDPQGHLFVDEHPLARATPDSGQHS